MKKALLLTVFAIFVTKFSFAGANIGTWRWRNNDGNEKTATWKAALDSPIVISNKNIIRLRLHMQPLLQEYVNTNLTYLSPVTNYFDTIKNAAMAPDAHFVFSESNSPVKYGEPTTEQLPNITSNYPYYPGAVITQFDKHVKQTGTTTVETELEWSIKPTDKVQPGTTYLFNSNAVSAYGGVSIYYAVLVTSGDINHPGDKVTTYHVSISNNLVTLNFTTALKGHDHFELQYQTPNNTTWKILKTIPGDNLQTHQTVFASPQTSPNDTTHYSFRIALFDLNKVMSVSPVTTTTFNAPVSSSALALKVYPNPATSNIGFNLNGLSGKTFSASVTGLYGQKVMQKNITVNSSGHYKLESNAAPGTYILNISDGKTVKSTRVQIQ